ncbi:Alkaline phosphatase [Phytophthora cinnamomi]|uniref:Alkaline phosphatase n=1 Tax=Phytophthora cinnamomi TaxID=4785 RepID=UPI0035598E5B|nr:Alkaline phosphatase [Phytophthora cinnamomi]
MVGLNRIAVLSLAVAIASTLVHAGTHYEYKTVDVDYNFDENEELPRSVIMMIPDGTGPNVFTLARTVRDPSLKTRLHIDPYVMGTVQTHSSTSYITDSAAAATAYATGFKTYDSAIAVDTFEQPLGTVLEAAKARGMVTGMVVTCRVTHATPASFAAHVVDRDSEDDIAAQYVANENLDFVLGGGRDYFNESMLEELKSSGYTIANDYQDLVDYQSANADTGALRLFGLFKGGHMTYEVDRIRNLNANATTAREPSLPEMVDIVLSLLRKNEQAKKHGYFMMIEGSRVDHAGHSNDPGTLAKEAIAFDETVAVVLDHMEQTPNTAMLSAADHGTGGLTLGRSGMEYPYPWYPTQLQQQNMSTEVMQEHLDEILASTECAIGANETCKTVLLESAKSMLANYTNVTSVTDDEATKLVTEIAAAVDETRDLWFVMVELGHLISAPAWIDWTTVGHVGTDVNLYCKGPLVFERMCKGVHENVYLNKLMTTFLGLEHQQELETLKHRNITVLEDPLVF